MTEPTLADFLLARIQDDEAIANGPESNSGTAYPTYLEELASLRNPRVQDHIARWDPARVLAECEAKRRIVEQWQGLNRDADKPSLSRTAATMADATYLALLAIAA